MEIKKIMNKLINYSKTIFVKTKLIYVSLSLLIIYILSQFSQFIKLGYIIEVNFYDFFIQVLGSYQPIAYFMTFMFVLLIYNISNKQNFYQYLLMKFKNKKQWFNMNVLMILFISISFMVILIIFSVLITIPSLKLSNQWSNYSIHLSNSMVNYFEENSINVYQFIINNISPMKFLLITSLYIIMYLTTLGIMYLVFSVLFKKKIFSIISLFVIIMLNFILYCSDSIIYKKISFFYNIILIDPYNYNLNYSLFYKRFLYWFLIIGVLIFCGNVIISKFDSNYEGI